MAIHVESLHAVEILDSRGRPTVAVELGLDGGGVLAWAGVPSGASTGSGRRSSCGTATPPGTTARAPVRRCRT